MPETLTGDRAYDRLLAEHIPSRGERRRIRARVRAVHAQTRWLRRRDRAYQIVQNTLLREKFEAESKYVIKLRSWKEASRVSCVGGDLWIRSRVHLKDFGHKRQRSLGGQMDSNAVRMQRVLAGELFKVTDRKSDKIRYINHGLAKRLAKSGAADRQTEPLASGTGPATETTTSTRREKREGTE